MAERDIADRPFRKSSFSAPDAGCVEVGTSDGSIQVRDSKDRRGSVLTFNEREWDAFVRGIKAGEFDLQG